MEGAGREIRLMQNKCRQEKNIMPTQQKNVLYAAVCYFQSEEPNDEREKVTQIQKVVAATKIKKRTILENNDYFHRK